MVTVQVIQTIMVKGLRSGRNGTNQFTTRGSSLPNYAIDNMDRAGISYVIWKQQFYMPVDNIYGPANTWNQMPDRGGDTANHYDHVHISFNG